MKRLSEDAPLPKRPVVCWIANDGKRFTLIRDVFETAVDPTSGELIWLNSRSAHVDWSVGPEYIMWKYLPNILLEEGAA